TVWMRDDFAQEMNEVVKLALNDLQIKQLSAVLDPGTNAVRCIPEVISKVEDGRAPIDWYSIGLQRCRTGFLIRRREELKQHLEQRVLTQVAIRLKLFHQTFERNVLVVIGAKRHAFHALQ